MDSFKRLLPYLYPHRRNLAWSVLVGVIVAALWGANLTVVFPIITTLIKGNLHEYVAQEIDTAAQELAKNEADLQRHSQQIEAFAREGLTPSDPRFVAEVRAEVKNRDEILQASLKESRWMWTQRALIVCRVPRDRFQTFTLILALLLVATVIKGVFIYIQDVLVGSVAELVVMDVRRRLFRQVLKLDYQSLATEGTGGLMSRFTYDTEAMAAGVTMFGGKLVREPLKCLACMIGALIINWRLTLLSLLFVPILAFTLQRYGKLLKRASRRMMESMSRIYKVLEETFDGLKVVIAFDTAQRHRLKFHNEYKEYYRKAMRVVQIDAVAKPTMEILGLVALLISMLPGAYLILQGTNEIWGVQLAADVPDLATLGMLYSMLIGMLDPCRKMSSTYSRLKKAAAATDRIFALLDTKPEVANPTEPVPLPRHAESIEFKNVTFAYGLRHAAGHRGVVLSGLDLKVAFGEVVAIVGQNGCGKSTLVNLLPRYFDPQAGDILIDGVSITDCRLADLRAQISTVTQDTVLFDDTIAGNIRYGSPQATREAVEQAARQAHVDTFASSLSQGLDTPMGEKGRELSGGQRQRVAMARAILRNPSILILDEATSAADPESESLIHQTLKELVKGRTALLITHALTPSVLDFVTRIVVMENGLIVGDGRHADLLRTCPLYVRLFEAPTRAVESHPTSLKVATDSPPVREAA